MASLPTYRGAGAQFRRRGPTRAAGHVFDPSETGPQLGGKQRMGVLSNPGELWTIVYTYHWDLADRLARDGTRGTPLWPSFSRKEIDVSKAKLIVSEQ